MNYQIEPNQSLIGAMRDSRCFLRISVYTKIFFFLSSFFVLPTAFAVDEALQAAQSKAEFKPKGKTDEEKLSNTLHAIAQNVFETKTVIDDRMEEESDFFETILSFFGLSDLRNESLDDLTGMYEKVQAFNEVVLSNFDQVESVLKTKNLSDAVLQEHYKTVEDYKLKYQTFKALVQDSLNAGSLSDQQETVDALNEYLNQHKSKRVHKPLDPGRLPYNKPDANKTREPVDTHDQLRQLLGNKNDDQLVESFVDTFVSKAWANVGPTEADLAETVDVQITDAIQQKAQELNHNPVEIYNWVRNHIEFLPTYGSIQGADHTLQTFSGNPFDTSSLLIALLRASDIPARYSYGTVTIPIDKVMNWVGDAKTPSAALQVLGQGGIPNIAIVKSGGIAAVKIEHVWVEAWVDFEPSKGAQNFQGDSWVALDASFKQYEYKESLDFTANVPFDAQSLVTTVQSQSVVNEAEGSIQGVPDAEISSAFQSYQAQLEAYINSQGSNLSVHDVLGGNKIIIEEALQLSSGLPYKVAANPQSFSVIPDNLRHKIRFILQQSVVGGFFGANLYSNVLSHEFSLPEVAGKTLSLSYKPATEKDNELLLSFVPDDNVDPVNINTTVPAYLMHVTAELNLNKENVVTAGSIKMGTQTNNVMQLYSPVSGWSLDEADGVAGEYRAIGVDVGTVSPKLLNKIKADAEFAVEKRTQDDLSGLTKHDLVGLMMQTNILGFFAMSDFTSHLQSQQFDVIEYSLPSYGYFHLALTPSYFFGIPRNVHMTGVTMDVPHLSILSASKVGDAQRMILYNKAVGYASSYYENWIPELTLSVEGNQLNGVSAVKLLGLAQASGQKVFTLTRDNSSQLSNIQIDADSRRDIIGAINAGKVVTVHEAPLQVSGWNGSGYLVIDPDSGTGGYMITGGANGGSASDALMAFSGWLLGMVDGAYGHLDSDKIGKAMFSDKLKSLQRTLKFSTAAGYFGLILGTINTFATGGLTWNSVGIAAVNLLAFVLTVIAVAWIAALTGPFLGAIIGGLIAIAIAMIAAALASALFG